MKKARFLRFLHILRTCCFAAFVALFSFSLNAFGAACPAYTGDCDAGDPYSDNCKTQVYFYRNYSSTDNMLQLPNECISYYSTPSSVSTSGVTGPSYTCSNNNTCNRAFLGYYDARSGGTQYYNSNGVWQRGTWTTLGGIDHPLELYAQYAATCTCSSNTCSAGYYGTIGDCTQCPSEYPQSLTSNNSTISGCYKACLCHGDPTCPDHSDGNCSYDSSTTGFVYCNANNNGTSCRTYAFGNECCSIDPDSVNCDAGYTNGEAPFKTDVCSPVKTTITLDSKYYATSSTTTGTAVTTNSSPTTLYKQYGDNTIYRNVGLTTSISNLTTNPAYTGYTFAGFYTGKAGTGTQVIDASGAILPAAATALANYPTTATWYAHYTVVSSVSCPSGQYLPANTTTCAPCPAGSYCASAGTYTPGASDQGITGTCTTTTVNNVTRGQYSTAGASSCSTCPNVESAHSSRLDHYGYYWSAAHDGPGGCSVYFTDDESVADYTMMCYYSTVTNNYGDSPNCQLQNANITGCGAGYYNSFSTTYANAPVHGSWASGWNGSTTTGLDGFKGYVCSTCASNQYSADGALTCSSCPSGYTATGTKASLSDCQISCSAGTRVATVNGGCTTGSGNWWTAAHTVSGGQISPINFCMDGYTISGSSASNHDNKNDCTTTVDEGECVATNKLPARYIRLYADGNTFNTDTHVVEIEAYTSYDATGTNLLSGKCANQTGTNSFPSSCAEFLMRGTDGNWNRDNWTSATAAQGNSLTWDLGSIQNLGSIKFGMYSDSRTYNDLTISVSTDFTHWTTVYGPADFALPSITGNVPAYLVTLSGNVQACPLGTYQSTYTHVTLGNTQIQSCGEIYPHTAYTGSSGAYDCYALVTYSTPEGDEDVEVYGDIVVGSINNYYNLMSMDNEGLLNTDFLGYDFGGWYYDEDFQEPVADDDDLDGDLHLYGDFMPISYDINYNMNGGTNNANNPSSFTVEDLPITLYNPTKTGYTFNTWQEGINTEYITEIEGSLLADMIDFGYDSLDLSAYWTPKVYKVTLNNHGATTAGTTAYWYQFNTHNPCYYYTNGTNLTSANCLAGSGGINITVPQKTGYTFGGYYTGENGGGTQYVNASGGTINNLYSNATIAAAADSNSNNTTLHAKWNVNTYTEPAGQYLKYLNGVITQHETCLADSYCPGFTNQSFAGENMGIESCEDVYDGEFPYSATGATSSGKCYKTGSSACSSVNPYGGGHGTATYANTNASYKVYGIDYDWYGASGERNIIYDDSGACAITSLSCNTGYQQTGTNGVLSNYVYQNTPRDTDHVRYKAFDNTASHNYGNQTGLTAGDWEVTHTDGTKISGTSKCSTSTGSYSNTGTPSNTSGQYCWCETTGYTLSGGSAQSLTNPVWVYATDGSSVASCNGWCTATCAMQITKGKPRGFRLNSFGDLGKTMSCTAKTAPITFNGNNGTIPSGGTTSATATYDANMPSIDTSKLPTRTGYTFTGYYDATTGGTKYYNANGSSARTWNKNTTTSTPLFARWTANEYSCSAGQYLRASDATCQTCPTGYYCYGVDDETFTGSDIGKESCSTETDGDYPYSDTGAENADMCYTTGSVTCSTYNPYIGGHGNANYANSTASYKEYFEGDGIILDNPSACNYTLSCNTGYASGAGPLSSYSIYNRTDIDYDEGAVAVDFGNNTQINFTTKCSSTSGSYGDTSTNVSDTYGRYGWAAVTGYTIGGVYTTVASPIWVMFENYKDCSEGYDFYDQLDYDEDETIFKKTLNYLGANPSCLPKTAPITFNGNNGTIPSGGTTSATATYDANMPSIDTAKLPTRSGYTFAGYYDATTGGTQYYNANGTSARTWNKDTTTSTPLYAQWSQCSCGTDTNATCTASVVNNQCKYTHTCTTGYYNANNNVLIDANTMTCTACGAGNFCPANATTPTACSTLGTGYTNTTTTASANTQCYLPVTGGYVRNGTSGTTLTQCAAGTYKAAHNENYGTSYTCDSCSIETYTRYPNSLAGSSSSGDCYSILTLVWQDGSTRTININYGEIAELQELNVPDTSIPGYSFDGWYWENNLVTEIESWETVDGDITIYGKWTPIDYDIEYTMNGGNNHADNPSTFNVEDLPITLHTPYKDGNTFGGWYDNSSFTGTAITSITSNNWYDLVDDDAITLYAKFVPAVSGAITLDSNFYLNGAENATAIASVNAAPSPVYTKYGVGVYSDSGLTTSVTQLSTIPQLTGYTFSGFLQTKTGGKKVVDGNGYFTSDALTRVGTNGGTTTWYAEWHSKRYALVYALNGGSYGTNHPESARYDETFNVDAPTHAHGTFAGWEITGMDDVTHTYGSQTTSATSISQTTATSFKNLRSRSGNVTFTAKWTCATGYTGDTCAAKTAPITFNGNNGTIPSGGTTSATATYDANMPSIDTSKLPTRTGYTFTGYYDATTGGTKYYNANGTSARTWNKNTTSSTPLYAQWTANTYTCSAGQYLQASTATCQTCPQNSYCAGFTSLSYTGNDLGKNNCEDYDEDYDSSDAGASDPSACYATRTVSCSEFNPYNDTHGTPTYTNNSATIKEYPSGMKVLTSPGACDITSLSCNTGYISSSNNCFTGLTNITSDNLYEYEYSDFSTGNWSYKLYFDNAPDYGYLNGISRCSSTNTGTSPSSTEGKYCWCATNSYTSPYGPQCVVSQSLTWVPMTSTYSDIEDCQSSCVDECWNGLDNSTYVASLLNTSSSGMSCTPKTAPITFNGNNGTIPSGGTTSATATYDANMPSIDTAKLPTRTGYTFAGYYDATTGGTKYYNADGSSARTWNKDTTTSTPLYAQWSQCSCGTDTNATCTASVVNNQCKYTHVCTTGYYNANNNVAIDANTMTCSACGAGNFCPANATTPTACSTLGTGYTNTTTTASSNTQCYLPVAAGNVRNGTSGTTLTQCAAGTYKAAHNEYYGTSYTCDSCGSVYPHSAVGSNEDTDCYATLSYVWQNGTTYTTDMYLPDMGNLSEGYTLSEAGFDTMGTDIGGYEFDGWYTGSSFHNEVGLNEELSGDTTVYGKWTPITYDISYDISSGPDISEWTNTSNPSTFTIEDLPITLSNPTSNGYTFDTWRNTDGDDITTIGNTEFSNMLNEGSSTVYVSGISHPTSYTITFNRNNGSWASGYSAPSSYTIESSTITLPTSSNITKTGYTFGGWYDNSGLTGSAVTSITNGSTGNKEYWAKWTTDGYTITYTLNGGTLPNGIDNPTAYTTESATITLPTPTKAGYIFAGWCDDSGLTQNCATNRTVPTGSTGNKSFYAKWTECGAGYFCANNVKTACSTLGTGYTNSNTTASLNTECYLPVAAGNVRNGTSGTTLTQCAAGTYKAAHNENYGTSYTCDECEGRTEYSAAGAGSCSIVSAGYYTTGCDANDNNCTGQTQCSGTVYCSAGVQHDCPDADTYKRTTFPANYGNATIVSTHTESRNGITNITQCRVFTNINSNRGKLFERTFYNDETNKYDTATGSLLWYEVNEGYYLTTKTSCGEYAYYQTSVECPTGSYCPGKEKVTCNNDNKDEVHTTTFGLEECPSGYPNSAAMSTAITQCYSNTKSRAWTGSQTPCTNPDTTGCSGVTCNTCSVAACNYSAYSNATGDGDGTIKDGCSTNNAACQQTIATLIPKTGYSTNGTTSCPANDYTITFNGNNGTIPSGGTTSATATYDALLPAIDTTKLPTRALYTFNGYFDATTSGNKYYEPSGAAVSGKTWDKADDTTLYAQWTQCTACSTTHAHDCNIAVTNNVCTYSATCDTGYSTSGGSNSGTSATCTGNSCVCLAKRATIVFNDNGGYTPIGMTTAATATYGLPMPVIDTTILPTREGYTFAGYYDTTATTGGTQYYTSAGASARTWDKDTTTQTALHARWTPINYTITYNLNSGTNNVNNPATYTIEDDDIVFAKPTRANYIFDGWYDNAQFTGDPITQIDSGSTGNVTLYAKWYSCPNGYYIQSALLLSPNTRPSSTTAVDAETWTATVNNTELTGAAMCAQTVDNLETTGDVATSTPVVSGTEADNQYCWCQLTDPSQSSWVLAWKYAKASKCLSETKCSTQCITQLNQSVDMRTSIYPQDSEDRCVAYVYDITYNLNGGKNYSGAPGSYTVESATITFEEPTRFGYTFEGWYDNAQFTGNPIEEIESGSTGDVTLYAKWDQVICDTNEFVLGAECRECPTHTHSNGGTATSCSCDTGYDGDPVAAITFGDFEQYNAYSLNEQCKAYDGTRAYTDCAADELADFMAFNPRQGDWQAIMSEGSAYGMSACTSDEGEYGDTADPNEYQDGDNSGTNCWCKVVNLNINGNTTSVINNSPWVYRSKVSNCSSGCAAQCAGNFGMGSDEYRNSVLPSNSMCTPHDYTITYAMNGGTNSVNNPSIYNIETNVTLVQPTKTGYTFNGWTITTAPTTWGTGSSSSGATNFVIATGTYGNMTLTAQWTQCTACSTTHAHDCNITVTNNVCTYAATCDTSYSTTGGNDTGTSAVCTGNSCVCQPRSFSLTYNMNGGYNSTDNPSTYTYGVGVASFSSPTKSPNMTFAGWYDNASFTGNAITSIATTASGDKSLYAKWSCPAGYVTSSTSYFGLSYTDLQNAITNYFNIDDFRAKASDSTGTSVDYASGGTGLSDLAPGEWEVSDSEREIKFRGVSACTTDSTSSTSNAFNGNETGSVCWCKATQYIIPGDILSITLASSWINANTYTNDTNCAKSCANYCGSQMVNNSAIKTAITGAITGYENNYCAPTYTITLDPNGGTIPSGGRTSVTTVIFEPMPQLNSSDLPTREGYIFQGYYSSTAGEAVKYYNSDGTVPYSGEDGNWDNPYNGTIYARWTSCSSTCSTGSSTATNCTQTVVNNQCVRSATCTPGFSTTGGNDTGTSAVCTGNSCVCQPRSPHTVTLNANGGTGGSSSITVSKIDETGNGDYYTDISSFTPPTRPGYKFAGWYDTSAATGGTKYYDTEYEGPSDYNWVISPWDIDTLYARWEPMQFEVIINYNGGYDDGSHYSETASVTATYGFAMPTLTRTPTWAEHTLDGAYDTDNTTGGTKYYNADGTSAHIWDKTVSSETDECDYYNDEEYDGCYVLYSRWNECPACTAGTGVSSCEVQVVNNQCSTVTGTCDTGYSTSGGSNTGTSAVCTNGTCVCQARTYTITFNANNGTIPTGGTTSATATYNATLPTIQTGNKLPTRTNHTFNGYYTSSNGGTKYYNANGTPVSGITWTRTSGITLYAQWTLSAISLSWDPDNGGSATQNTCQIGGNVVLPTTPTKPGYTFKGWKIPTPTAGACLVDLIPVIDDDLYYGYNYGTNGSGWYTELNSGTWEEFCDDENPDDCWEEDAVDTTYGTVNGTSTCAANGGEGWGEPGTPSGSGDHCWCSATSYTPDGGESCPVSQVWTYFGVINEDDWGEPCNASSCGYACAETVAYEGSIRRTLLSIPSD